jgi:tetratricopeptide (TPR) repeat protein
MPNIRQLVLALASLAVGLGLVGAGGAWWYSARHPDARLRRGQEALRRGNPDQAEQLAERLEAGGHAGHAALLRGQVLFEQQRYAQALREFQHVQAPDALHLDATAFIGQCLVHLRRPNEAASVFRALLDERPDHVDAHRGLAAIYYDQGALEWAVRHCEEWARLDPADGRPYRFMGVIHKDRPIENDLAIAAYQNALQRELSDGTAEEVRQELAECLVKQSDFAEALEVLDRCTTPARATSKLAALRAECLWGLGRAAEAEALLDEALAAHPRALELLRLRGKLHLDARQPREAVARLEQALQVDRHDHASRYLLAQVYESLGQATAAAEHRRLLQETQEYLKTLTQLSEEATHKPWDAGLRWRMAEVCEQLNKPELAKMWRQAAAACPQGK